MTTPNAYNTAPHFQHFSFQIISVAHLIQTFPVCVLKMLSAVTIPNSGERTGERR
jgi:hypothetical protein